MFSVLVEKIPLDSSPEQLRYFFNQILIKENVQGRVKDIIFLQDYYQYKDVQNKLEEVNKKLTHQGLSRDKERVLFFNKLLLEDQFKELQRQISKQRLFKGKAIVIFDTIQAKVFIYKLFAWKLWKAVAYRYFGLVLNKCYFKGKLLSVKEAKEPQDLILQNIYYPTIKKFIREVIVYSASYVIMFSCWDTLANLQFWIKTSKDPLWDYENPYNTLKATGFVLKILI